MNSKNLLTITSDDLVKLGYAKATAQQIIRQTKLNMVQQGYTIYNFEEISWDSQQTGS